MIVHCLIFKTIVSTYLIGRNTSQSRAPPDGKERLQEKLSVSVEQGNLPPDLPKFQNIWRRC